MIYGSVCSGIEAATVAWEPLGWRCAFMSEVAAFPRRVLKTRFPGIPLHGDFTQIKADDVEPIDLLVGGTPCQSFSVAGLRGGLADDRGNLTLEFLRLVGRLRPRWVVWENVPGVFSSISHAAPDPSPPPPPLDMGCDGAEVETEDEYESEELHAFACFLAGLSELGYGFAYRTLDAQHFGIPQRRRRVFVVGHSGGDWRSPAAVLFERHSLSGNHAPRRQAREGSAAAAGPGPDGRGLADVAPTVTATYGEQTGQDARNGALALAFGSNDTRGPIDVATTLNAHDSPLGRLAFDSETFVTYAPDVAGTLNASAGRRVGTPNDASVGGGVVAFSANDDGGDAENDLSPTIRAGGHHHSHANGGVAPAVAYAIQAGALRENPDSGPDGAGVGQDVAYTVEARAEVQAVAFAVRGREEGAVPEVAGDGSQVSSLRAASGGSSRDYVAIDLAQVTHPANATRAVPGAPSPTLNGRGDIAAFSVSSNSNGFAWEDPDIAPTVQARTERSANQQSGVRIRSAVRRLTPEECEALQGFPRGWTDVAATATAHTPDGPRYKAVGNSFPVPVVRWIGQRIAAVDALQEVLDG